MSKFNRYGKELDATVRAYFARYQAAEAKVKSYKEKIREKERELRDFHVKGDRKNEWSARYDLEGLRVQLNEAEDDFSELKKSNYDALKSIREIRDRLEAAANEEFVIDPSKVDANTLTLINSGIMKAADFEVLAAKASSEKNYTMLRLLGPAASAKAEELRNNGRYEDAQRLTMVSATANQYRTESVLEQYDELVSVAKMALGDPQSISLDRAQPNPLLYGHWDELTGEAFEDF